jgi:hypothetical protein
MSDHSIAIVPKLSSYAGKENKVKEILAWLVDLDIVKPTLSDCVLGSNGGYAVSTGARLVTPHPDHLPFDLITNGLEIDTDRQVFDNGGNGVEQLICPACRQDLANEDWDFLDEWASNGSDNITCPLCKAATDIHLFVFSPEWGFSDLGFTFWNWPGLTDRFIADFKEKLGCDINVVYRMI